MRNTIYLMLVASALVFAACVDDYTDSNDAPLMDAPTIRVSSAAANQTIVVVPENAYQNGYEAYLVYGQPVEYTVSVIDAPGKIGAVSVTASVPDFGSVTIDEASVAAIQGQESGE